MDETASVTQAEDRFRTLCFCECRVRTPYERSNRFLFTADSCATFHPNSLIFFFYVFVSINSEKKMDDHRILCVHCFFMVLFFLVSFFFFSFFCRIFNHILNVSLFF